MKIVFGVFLSVMFSSAVSADVTPEHVEQMLKQMVKESVISQEEADKAKARMLSMSPGQWGEVNKTAQGYASRMPASAATPSNNKIEEVHQIDFDGDQFKQIQNDLRRIAPQYND